MGTDLKKITIEDIRQEAARRKLEWFAKYVNPQFVATDFHKRYYKILDMFAEGRVKNLIIQAPPQHGKLIADSTLVPTPDGMKRHGDIQVNDFVFGRDGQPVRVLWKSDKMNTGYRLTFSTGQKVDCHGAHEWVVYDRYNKNQVRIIETRNLRPLWRGKRGQRGSSVMYHVAPPACLQYSARPVPVDAYTFGAWIGDGKAAEPVICIGNNDTEIIQGIPYETREQCGTTCRPFSIIGIRKQLQKFLNNKHISEDYIYNSVEVRRELIAGLVDTDGYVYDTGRVTITNTNKQVIEVAAQIIYSLGHHVTVCEYVPRLSSSGIQGRKVVYQLSFSPSMTFPTRVPRKRITRVVPAKKIGIVGIEKIDGEMGNCIQVEGGVYQVGQFPVLTHNSEGSSRNLPAKLLGMYPEKKIILCSYAATIARDFNRDTQRIMDTPEYRALYPDTKLVGFKDAEAGVYQRNSDVFQVVGHKGEFRVVGRGGALTSKTADVMIFDDLYKGSEEANSPVIRAGAWDWYTKTAGTRGHNDTQSLIVFTRWHPDDIIGEIIKKQEVIYAQKWSDFDNIPDGAWVLVNFEAIKTGEPTEIDPREKGQALWPERHSEKKLIAAKELDPIGFQCLYQGNPKDSENLLYQPFKTYTDKAEWGTLIRKGCYIDVADSGNDYLSGATYDIYKSNEQAFNEKTKRFEPILYALITDIEYTDADTETTGVTVPAMINRNGTQKVWVESNNGGSQFKRHIEKKIKALATGFYQSANKESRIVANAPYVNQSIIMPFGWDTRFPRFYQHITGFLRTFIANEHDDGADMLTGIYEKEIADGNLHGYGNANRGIKVH